jgi:hypothetical protein
MKFIAGKAALDIPCELLEAQENDNLILFCGAGISYPAGLPLFKGLVDDVYQILLQLHRSRNKVRSITGVMILRLNYWKGVFILKRGLINTSYAKQSPPA